MATAFGIITAGRTRFHVEGLEDYRPIGSISFLGRYRLIDFPISNMSNSNIDRIQVYARSNSRSLVEHVGNGSYYNINSKRGKLQVLFGEENSVNDVYNTDIAAYYQNIEIIERMHQNYVIIAPGYMVYVQDFDALLKQHIESGADISLLYHKVNDAKTNYRNCNFLDMNRQKGVKSIEVNDAEKDDRNIFMDTFVMSKDLFVKLIRKARSVSSVFSLVRIINLESEDLDIRAIQHKGYFAAITDFKSYFDANMNLLNIDVAKQLFEPSWPIYTHTTDSSPVQYFEGASIKNSVVANGSLIKGCVENSVIGRGVIICKGAVVKNCIILGHCKIGDGIRLENQVIDKWAKIQNVDQLIADPDRPGYIRRDDVI
ncbi:MAG: glucose-1-phosphate adenylyltransferase subunit GlgD [Lachnospiraceae bacterium]|nr:glucose-1-phosphate adenylyltransferase subunit GlgD [Lachnospiraceae bacterium]